MLVALLYSALMRPDEVTRDRRYANPNWRNSQASR